MVRAMCGVQLKELKSSMESVFGLNETIVMAMANSVC